MKFKLSQRERILVAGLYFIALLFIFYIVGGHFDTLFGKESSDSVIWFTSGALMIIMGSYIVEPYFTKPSDVVANAIAALIALLGLSSKDSLVGYHFIFYYALSMLVFSLFSIVLKNSSRQKLNYISKCFYKIVETFGSSKVIFSIIYLAASYSYFAEEGRVINFIIVIAFWVVLTFFDVLGILTKKAFELFKFFSKIKEAELGIAIGCDNPFMYKVEVETSKLKEITEIEYGKLVAIETSQNIGSVGMIIDQKHLLEKRWLKIYLLKNADGNLVTVDLRPKKLIVDPKSIFTQVNAAFSINLETLPEAEQEIIMGNLLFKNKNNFAGYVASGSNINTINFCLLKKGHDGGDISEGVVLKTAIYGDETLYQVINGHTKEEHLENFDTHGFTVGIARKLGKYTHADHSLDVSKWMPDIYSPLFFATTENLTLERKIEFAEQSIGHLPGTGLMIPIKDIHSVVTHNTAILGILGIGKSCLTFELIKKVVANTESKIICFDITGEYIDELVKYGCTPSVLNDTILNYELGEKYKDINKDVQTGGNRDLFRTQITELVAGFLDSTKRVLIINPDDYDVSKQAGDVKPKKIGPGPNDWQDQAPMADLTLVEKTRIISEAIFAHLKSKGKTKEARCLIVFEEAHSLVPEWNSVASEGDKSATNGTAKVILQGRKFGLGSFIVTQRTANVSKTILNQCNTVFALRVFDDTGKEFLANYIGKEYSDTLPTLEERRAIAIGMGLRLKQPVIIQLNDQAHVNP